MARDAAITPSNGARRRVRRLGWVLAGALIATGGIVVAAAESIDGPADVSIGAERVPQPLGDVVSVFDILQVDQFVVEASFAVAEAVGGSAAAGRTHSFGMVNITRNGNLVHGPPDGWLIPMATLGLPEAAVAGIVGADVSSVLDVDTVALNEITAQITGAQVGDVLTLRAEDGSPQAFAIAAIRPNAQVGGSDIVMTIDAVDRLGFHDDTRMVIWGIDSRPAAESALQTAGLTGRKDARVLLSWASADPDDTLSTPRTKQLLGEPWYSVVSGDTITMHPTWMANNLPSGRILLNSSIPIRARCHLEINDALGAALAEVAAAGLGGAIDVANANTYGGCFNPRYSRNSGFLSRHAYGLALDTNTVSNCQGCVPQMNCNVVRIFRKHGFAWGGNFRQPDGMHFEWVGERRDQIPYASKYCPNITGGMTESTGATAAPAAPAMGNDVLSITDEHDHEH